MKKTLFLALFTLYLMCGNLHLYGQAIHDSDPQELPACTDDPLHPIAGKAYNYSVEVTPEGGDFIWWATTGSTFISNGIMQNSKTDGMLDTPDIVRIDGAQYNRLDKENSISLSWGSHVLANTLNDIPAFVAVYYRSPICGDNLKIFRIQPINAFIVDVLNLNHDTKDALPYGEIYDQQCYSPIESATWSDNTISYDYGKNELLFEVVAANFTGSWRPTFMLSGLKEQQEATIEWAYDKEFTNPIAAEPGIAGETSIITNENSTENGVSVYVRVSITNNNYEGLSSDLFTLSVIGTNEVGQRDVLADCSGTATFESNSASQILLGRPTISGSTTGGDFE